ncbi:MAG: hypothetical protein KDN18_18630 [Verrucomicrobiae bacterium]|nr:hypothetical protein [Verrucomicrobiae bacterium]
MNKLAASGLITDLLGEAEEQRQPNGNGGHGRARVGTSPASSHRNGGGA